MDGDLLASLRTHANELGLSESQVLRLARGVVVVEGKQDEDVLRHFFGARLAGDRLFMLSLYGTGNVPTLVEVDFLKLLGVPVGVLLDGQLRLAEAMGKQHGVHFVQLGLPDILCCLPDQATREALAHEHGISFPGWSRLAREYERRATTSGIGFKDFLTTRLGLPRDARDLFGRPFIHRVLQASQEAEPAPHLARAVSTLTAALISTTAH